MDRMDLDGVALAWDASRRLLSLSFTRNDVVASAATAAVLLRQVEAWTSSPGARPFRLLVDCARVRDADPSWRSDWAAFVRAHRPHVRVAWHDAGPMVRTIIRMFVLGTRVDGATFATRAQALAWLEKPFAKEPPQDAAAPRPG